MKISGRFKLFFVWLATAACLAGVPAVIIFVGLVSHWQLKENRLEAEIKLKLQQAAVDSAYMINQERYWCLFLREKFRSFNLNRKPAEDIISWLSEQKEQHEDLFEFLVWDKSGFIAYKTFETPYTQAQWYQVFLSSVINVRHRRNIDYVTPRSEPDIETVRKVLGPQYVGSMSNDNSRRSRPSFAWTDSAKVKPPSWVYFTSEGGFMLFFDIDKLEKPLTLQQHLSTLSLESDYQFGLYFSEENTIFGNGLSEQRYPELIETLMAAEDQLATFKETDSYYLAYSFLSYGIRLFAVIPKQMTDKEIVTRALIAALVFLIIMIPLMVYSFNLIVKKVPCNLSIKTRLLFLFLFASIVPFMVMRMFATEYYEQRKINLMRDAQSNLARFLENYDNRMISHLNSIELSAKIIADEWVKQMPGKTINEKTIGEIASQYKELLVEEFFLIASDSSQVGTYDGIYKVSSDLSAIQAKIDDSNYGEPAAQVVTIIAGRLIDELNGITYTSARIDQFELIAETVLQRPMSEVTYTLIETSGGISPWGYDDRSQLALTNFLSLPGSEQIDYLIMGMWVPDFLQANYVSSTIRDVNRNPDRFRLIAQDQRGEFYPVDSVTNQAIESYIERLPQHSSNEIEIIEISGQKYMITGLRGNHICNYNFVGLYPLKYLDRIISAQQRELMLLSIFALLLTVWLARMLAQNFLMPLLELRNAANAIEKRDFQFRIKYQKKDEFGQLGQIFNDIMVSFGELEVAKVVQDSLFPAGELETEKFKVYGKSVAMNELGGDYFDYFITEQGKVAVLVGDVAGHGVSAALIMAMAKAAIIKCSDLKEKPEKLLAKLHYMIHSFKSKSQRKIMTFQYLLCDQSDDHNIYSNAGACSPVYVDKNNNVKEISLVGSPLGAFKKSKFKQKYFSMNSQDAIVFYTDGIIEASDAQGIPFGYEKFKQVVAENKNDDPKAMYEKIYAAYLAHVDSAEPDDDVTIVIVTKK